MKESWGANTPTGAFDIQVNSGGGSGFEAQNTELLNFAGLLCEFSKYNPDLKAILENSKLSTEQNQNQHSDVNPYANNSQIVDNPFLKNNNGNYSSTGNSISNSSTNFETVEDSNDKINNTENKNGTIGSNVSSSRSEYITPNSIYSLLTSEWIIMVDTSKLPEYLQQIINKLVNNNDLNNPSNNQSGNLITSNTPFSSNNVPVDNQNNKQNKQLVCLDANKFQDLIYYFIINAVAKEKKMEVLTKQDQKNNSNDSPSNNTINPYLAQTNVEQNVNNAYSNAKQKMQECFYRRNNCEAYQIYWDYRKSVGENSELKNFIANKEANKKSESNNFWRPFLWGVLKRASFLISLYNLFTSGQNRRKYAIDTVLGSFHVLFLVSLIFGWGAIANPILGLITLAVLVYKAVNQYKQPRPRHWLYNLLITDPFHKMAEKRDFALAPEVGNLYEFYSQNAGQIVQQELYANEQMKQQYPNSQYPNSQYPNSQYPNSQQGQIY